MRLKEDSVTLVIAGAWNVNIFTPAWVKEYLFKEDEFIYEVSINLGNPPRYSLKDNSIRFFPSFDKLIFSALDYSDSNLLKIEGYAKIICELLSHTPIAAFGCNGSFIEIAETNDLVQLFSLRDTERLSKAGWKITNPKIVREIQKDNLSIKMTIEALEDYKKFLFAFNTHFQAKHTQQILEKIDGVFLKSKQTVEKILNDHYGLTYDPSGE